MDQKEYGNSRHSFEHRVADELHIETVDKDGRDIIKKLNVGGQVCPITVIYLLGF